MLSSNRYLVFFLGRLILTLPSEQVAISFVGISFVNDLFSYGRIMIRPYKTSKIDLANKRMSLPSGPKGSDIYRLGPLLSIKFLYPLSILLFLSFSQVSKIRAQNIVIELEDTTKKPWQFKMPPKFSFGLRGGLNIAQIFGSGSQVFNHFGFSGGLRFGYRFHRNFSFDPEVLYNMKGAARYPNVEKGDYYSFSVDLDYIELPLLFNYYFGKRKNFSLEFGPSVGFLVRQKAYENQVAINTTNTGFNIYDISLAVGFNYHMRKGFGLNFRFMNSIVPIQPTYGTLPWGVSTISIGQLNSVINFSLFYKFDLRTKEQKLLDGDVPKEKHKREKFKKENGDVIDED